MAGDSIPYALFSLSAEPSRISAFRLMESLLPEGRAADLTQIVRRAVRDSAIEPGTIRIRVDLGADPMIRIGRSMRCPPDVSTRFRIQSVVAMPPNSQPRPVRVRLVVAEDGRILNVTFLGNSGNPMIDRVIHDELLRRTVPPGLVDGSPVQMEHEQLIDFRSRG